jgi:hypothetical protein
MGGVGDTQWVTKKGSLVISSTSSCLLAFLAVLWVGLNLYDYTPGQYFILSISEGMLDHSHSFL